MKPITNQDVQAEVQQAFALAFTQDKVNVFPSITRSAAGPPSIGVTVDFRGEKLRATAPPAANLVERRINMGGLIQRLLELANEVAARIPEPRP